MLHEPGEVFEVAPEPVDLLPGPVDRDRAADLDAAPAPAAHALGRPAELLAGKALRVGQGSVAAGSIAGAAMRLRVRVLPPIGGPPVGANGLLCGCGHRSPFCFRSWLAYRCVPRGAGCSAIRVWVRGCVVVGRSRAGPSCFTMRTAYRKREPRAPGLRKCADR